MLGNLDFIANIDLYIIRFFYVSLTFTSFAILSFLLGILRICIFADHWFKPTVPLCSADQFFLSG